MTRSTSALLSTCGLLQDLQSLYARVLLALLAEGERGAESVSFNIPDDQDPRNGFKRVHGPTRLDGYADLLGIQSLK